ncbi:prohibitin-like protein [Theileria orientalis]|uniref:Prohibitin-like protein n=1 Tax=Theileria orientalis TaxID=68886 RepID=A0A976QT54_THEOR|nr:prohibitin-like protein [Theileria orientalis]
MYNSRFLSSISRNGKMFFSIKNVDIKSLKPTNFDISSTSDAVDPSKQEYISPLYTQNTGMFTKPGVTFWKDKSARFTLFKLYIFSIVTFIASMSMIKVVPDGHVGLVTRKSGKIDQFNNKGRLAIFYIPFVDKAVSFRITPIRKKIIRKCLTSDSKEIEVVIFLTVTAKEAFASHIYSIFGPNFSNTFVEKELNFDIDQVIKKYKMEDLVLTPEKLENIENLHKEDGGIYSINSTIERANNDLIERFNDAGSFNKIDISDVVR